MFEYNMVRNTFDNEQADINQKKSELFKKILLMDIDSKLK